MQSRCSRWKWNGNRRNCSVAHINGESIWSEDVSLFVMSSFAFYSNNYLLIAIVFFASANVCVRTRTRDFETLYNEENTIDLCTIVIDLNGEAIARGTEDLKWIIDRHNTHEHTNQLDASPFDSIRLLLLLLLAALIPIHSHRFVYVCDHDAKCKFTSMLCASCIFRMRNCMFALCFSLTFIFIC